MTDNSNQKNQGQQQGQQGDSQKQAGAPDKVETQPKQEQSTAPAQEGDKTSSPR